MKSWLTAMNFEFVVISGDFKSAAAKPTYNQAWGFLFFGSVFSLFHFGAWEEKREKMNKKTNNR